jgi:hypothetical protein
MLYNVVGHLIKIGLWRKDNTTGTHHRFCNESSNLERKIIIEPNATTYELFLHYITFKKKGEKRENFTVSGPSLRIRFSKLLASLVENSSSVSSILQKNHLVSVVSLTVRENSDIRIPERRKRQ